MTVQDYGLIDICSKALYSLSLNGLLAGESALKADALLTHGFLFNSNFQLQNFKAFL
jgi:hypothetical protein